MYSQNLQRQRTGHAFAALGTLGAMLLLPYLVHLIPPQGGVPLGARLLPIFFAPLIAVFLFDLRSAIVAALLAPVLNYLIIGSPNPAMVVLLTIELVVFCVAAYLLCRQKPGLVIIGPVAYVTAVAAAALVQLVVSVTPMPALTFFVSSISNALPGMLILLIINIVLVRYFKAPDAR